ncbi:MAG: hypothetical protein JXB49_02100 [Bacteroidales bacterium]|nr:hypothetical protein [Bacteroidales bacterium]
MLIFNSKTESPEKLEELLVGRKKIVDAIEKSVNNALSSYLSIQHLIIGPRGSGKTHIIQVLFNRFNSNKTIKEKAEIAYMAEEEIGIDSLFSLFVRIFEAFIRWNDTETEKEEWKNKIGTLKNLSQHEREDKAKEFLLTFLKEKKLIILIENINDVFSGLKKAGQAKLRDFIQQYEKIILIATSQVLFTDIQNEDKPFHNFFQIIHLNRLSEAETKTFLKTLANIEGPIDLKAHLQTVQGISQMKSIHFLSSGNHRLIALFYEFLKNDIKSDMAKPFLQTLDKLKPYYESFLRYLPPQQQKIIHFLALKHNPQLGSVITKECFLSPGGTSKQMYELQNKGFVEAHRRGRDNLYELAEPMMRFCIELTDNRDGIIGMLARFITVLYSDTEIINRYLKLKYLSTYNCQNGQFKRNYYDEILIYGKAGGENTNDLTHLENLIQTLNQGCTKDALFKIAMIFRTNYKNCPNIRNDCPCSIIMNKKENTNLIFKIFIIELLKYSLFEEAFSLVNNICKSDDEKDKNNEYLSIPIIFVKGLISNNINKETIKNYVTLILELPINDLSKKLIKVLYDSEIENNKNSIFNLSKEERKILTLIDKTLSIYHYPPEMLDIRTEHNDTKKGLLYNQLIENYPSNSYLINNYANFLANKNRKKEANKYFLKAIELNPNEAEFTDDYGLFQLHKNNDIELAKKYFIKSLEIDKESTKYWIRYVDLIENYEKNIPEAKEIYLKMVKLFPDSRMVNLNYGVFLFYNNDDIRKALSYFNKVIKIDSKNSWAYYYKSRVFYYENDFVNSIKYVSRSINLDPENINSYYIRSLGYFEIGKYQNAEKDIIKILEKFTEKDIKKEIKENNFLIIRTILNSLLIGIINNNTTLILKIEKLLDSTFLSGEIKLNYKIILHIKGILSNKIKMPSIGNYISSLYKIYDLKKKKYSFEPLMTWLGKSESKMNKNTRTYLLNLIREIEKQKSNEISN